MDIFYKNGLLLLDVYILFEDKDNFDTMKERIIQTLYRDKRYFAELEKIDKIELENEIRKTERNIHDYYIFNVGEKEYKVALKPRIIN